MGGADDICPLATPLGMENGSMFTVTSSKLLCRWQEHFLQNSTGLAGKTRQTNTYKVKMTTWFKCSARQSSISINIIQRCTKSKSLLHILLWVSQSFSQVQQTIISKHGTSKTKPLLSYLGHWCSSVLGNVGSAMTSVTICVNSLLDQTIHTVLL